jgi:hypothetical protein
MITSAEVLEVMEDLDLSFDDAVEFIKLHRLDEDPDSVTANDEGGDDL